MISVGVIGYGYWGPNLVRNFAEVPGARVVAVCDREEQRLALIPARYPSVRVTTRCENLISDPEIDAIVIATPISTHFELALQALKAGKHVLVEKPLASTVEQAERLIEEAERGQRVLLVDHTFVYTGAVRKIKELVDSGQLGRLYYYDSVRVNLGLFQPDVNVLWDLAVHDLAIMDYVLGAQPRAVSVIGIAHVPGKPENLAYLTCFFDSHLIAHFHVNWLAPLKVRRTLVGGDRQMIVYDDLEPDEKVKVYDRGITLHDGNGARSNGVDGNGDPAYQLLVNYRAGDMWSPKVDRTEALFSEARHFIDCIETGRAPLTGAQAGLRVVRILEAADRSLASGGGRVPVDGPDASRSIPRGARPIGG